MSLESGRKKFHLFTVPAERADSCMSGEITVRQARSWLVGSGSATSTVPYYALLLLVQYQHSNVRCAAYEDRHLED